MTKYEEFLKNRFKTITFIDVFDIDEIQKIQDEFAYSMQIASIITDLTGKPITQPSNFSGFCRNYIRKTDKGLEKCMHSDSVIGGANTGGYTVSKCLSAGLMDAGVSIVVGGIHIGNWLFGQIRDELSTDNEDELRERANSLDLDPEEFIREYKNVPMVSRERFQHIANFVALICEKLSVLGYQKIVQEVDARYRELIQEELQLEKERIERANAYDTLTGLYNRNYYENQLERFQVEGTVPIAVIMGDVNHLKLTNDVFGHRHGDDLLKEIASVMKEESFEGYIISRSGGDEFNVIIPGGNRQDAEWYIHRVRKELEKRFNLCVMPSIAFGVSKKTNKEENLINIMELADIKMYRNKIEMKEKEDILNNMKRVLHGRGFITTELYERSNNMARDFGKRLGYSDEQLKKLSRLVRIQDYGYIILERELFKKRFNNNLSIEEKREIKKHPVIGSKIAKLNNNYSETSEWILYSHENWDGTGYPNKLKEEEIPEFSRLIHIMNDYILASEEKPIGMGMTKKEAFDYIHEGIGTLYDPNLTEKFLKFIHEYELNG